MNRITRISVVVMTLATLVLFAGCATIKHGLGARAEQADLCRLTVDNQTPYTFKFRVGHWWWEEQAGLLPHTTTGNHPMLIEQDEEHILVRVISVEGRVVEDHYYFYVPKGTQKHTIIFGGTQTGVWVNRSGVTAKVVSSSASQPVLVHNGEKAFGFQVLPGRQKFVVFFGPDFRRYREITLRIDDVRGDNYVEVEAPNGQGMIVKQWVDWIGYIEPEDVRQAGWLPSYRPDPAYNADDK